MKYVFLLLLLTVSLCCQAAVYQQTDSQGNTTYSDEPSGDNAQPVVHESPSALPAQNGTTQSNNTPSAEPVKTVPTHQDYSVFAMISPQDQETFQNSVTIPIAVKLEPALQASDTIQAFVDGKAWGAPATTTTIELSGIERGAHQVYLTISDKNHMLLKKSDVITIFVHRASVNFR